MQATVLPLPESRTRSRALESLIHRSSQQDIRVATDCFSQVRSLARGNMGEVFLAHSERFGCEVAVKFLPLSAEDSNRARFLREVRGLSELCHPNIVPLLDFGTCDTRYYLSMRYVPGTTFAAYATAPGVELEAKVELLRKVAVALHYAHGQGIVHRDVKPANILVDEEGEPFLADFGLAKHLSEDVPLTRLGTTVGTPMYMAPEQVRGGAELVSPALDVYAVGAILYEILVGRPPHCKGRARDTLQAIVFDPVIPPRALVTSVPRDLEAICLKALRKDIGERYRSAAALADDLDQWLRGEPLAWVIEPAPRQRRGWLGRAWDGLRSWLRG